MNISIFGMGYVGVVSAACLLRDGHDVTGVDIVESKIKDLAQGHSPIQEPGVAEMLAAGHAAGRLRATTDHRAALDGCDIVWICVGTPMQPDGQIGLAAVESAAEQIGAALKGAGTRPLIVLRSTILPGTTAGRFIPILEKASGFTVGREVHVVFHPEFLREGSAVADFDAPPKIVVGTLVPEAADRLMTLYPAKYEAPRHVLTLGESEMVKYCDNLFHAVKITFANEVGSIAHNVGVDARRVAEVFLSDRKLNISPYYLRPGFAYGGSCLPKDTAAILRFAALQSIQLPMLEGVAASNVMQIERFVARVLSHHPKTVGMVGLAFKPNTDDMRESPYMKVAKRLIGEGVQLRIFDPGVDPGRLTGSNRAAVQGALGHIEPLLVPQISALDSCDLVIINHRTVDHEQVRQWTGTGIRVIDLVNVGITAADDADDLYEGIAW